MQLMARPSFVELFTPKLITVFREGYSLESLRADIFAGMTVAVVALPLSIAIAIASGVSPDRGLIAAIVGGFFVSLLGGSRFQVGGPAGAFIVLVGATVRLHGLDGLIMATFLSGIILVVGGYLRLGTFIKYIPFPVTIGFTAGIAIIIGASQIKDLLGLSISNEPISLLPKLAAIGGALPSFSVATVTVAGLTMALILLLRRYRPHWPSFMLVIGAVSLAAWFFKWPVDTIGSRFGEFSRTLPMPVLPAFTLEKIAAVLPAAFSFALLGAIESLLCAVVADSMTGRRHRSNCELVAQGVANIASSLFGGICVTGTIARTATNIRVGARSPLAGLLHAVFLLVFLLIAAPLASYIPMASLAAILVLVAWAMADKHDFWTVLRSSKGDGAVLLITFALTVWRDLTEGIVIGFCLSTVLFLHRMAESIRIENLPLIAEKDVADLSTKDGRIPYDPAAATDPNVVVYRITGAFFFGAASSVGAVLDRVAADAKIYVVDFSAVSILDSTAAFVIESFIHRISKRGAKVFLVTPSALVRRLLLKRQIRKKGVAFMPSLSVALATAHRRIESINI